MDILEEVSGNRVNYAMNVIGGSRRDIDKDKIKPYLEYCYNKYKTERLEKLYD